MTEITREWRHCSGSRFIRVPPTIVRAELLREITTARQSRRTQTPTEAGCMVSATRSTKPATTPLLST